MISLREARAFQSRLARGDRIRLRAVVKARMKPGNFEVVTRIIPGRSHITKAIFHLTRTPASLPSFVNDVAATIIWDRRRRTHLRV